MTRIHLLRLGIFTPICVCVAFSLLLCDMRTYRDFENVVYFEKEKSTARCTKIHTRLMVFFYWAGGLWNFKISLPMERRRVVVDQWYDDIDRPPHTYARRHCPWGGKRIDNVFLFSNPFISFLYHKARVYVIVIASLSLSCSPDALVPFTVYVEKYLIWPTSSNIDWLIADSIWYYFFLPSIRFPVQPLSAGDAVG